jgi:two-component system, response regulator RegA
MGMAYCRAMTPEGPIPTSDSSPEALDLGPDPSLLLVDDDEAFLRRLGRAMERRGFQVEMAGSVAQALEAIAARPPAYAVVDLRLGDGNGLDVV